MSIGGKVYVGTTLVANASRSDQYHSDLTTDGVVTASSTRSTTTCTASATPHTWGSWVEIDPSLSGDIDQIRLVLTAATSANATDTSTLLQIGTGGSGAETAWATVGVGYAQAGRAITIPGRIASGTRVAVRCQSAAASKSVAAVYTFHKPKELTFSGAPITWGADTATSRGITLTAPGSTNTKGAWTTISASTSAAITALAVTAQAAGGTALNSDGGVLIDLAVGASSSEVVVISDLFLLSSASEWYTVLTSMTYGIDIPAGSRVSARYARSSTGNTVDLIVVGA